MRGCECRSAAAMAGMRVGFGFWGKTADTLQLHLAKGNLNVIRRPTRRASPRPKPSLKTGREPPTELLLPPRFGE
jgi:hypothetical protein